MKSHPPVIARLLRSFARTFSFIRTGIRFRIIRAALKAGGTKPFDFEVEFFGYKYAGNIASHIDFSVYFFGAYELGTLRKFEELAPPGTVVLDIGANVGHHSLFFSRFAKHVYSFEPYPRVGNILVERMRANNVRNVTWMPFGLGARGGEAQFFEPTDGNLGTGSFNAVHSAENRAQGLQLKIRKGDEVVQELPPGRIGLIKIDVEGNELGVLTGLQGVLREHLPVVGFEYSAKNAELAAVAAIFPRGYTFHSILGQWEDRIRLKKVELTDSKDGFIFALPPGRLP
jgi:FkbM family methyltransferase